MRIAVSMILFVAMLAGCTDELATESIEGDHVHGAFATCPDGTRLDPASYPEHHWEEFDLNAFCAPDAGLNVVLMSNVTKMRAYTSTPVAWYVEPAAGIDHTLRTSLRLASVGEQPPASGDDFGEEVAGFDHSNLPNRFEGLFVPEIGGDYELWAYAEGAGGASHWDGPWAIEVVGVGLTGTVHDFALSAGAAAASLSPGTLNIVAGDAFRIVSEDAIAHTFSITAGPAEFDIFAPPMDTSDEYPLFEAGRYEFKDDSFDITGVIEVAAPEIMPHSAGGAGHDH